MDSIFPVGISTKALWIKFDSYTSKVRMSSDTDLSDVICNHVSPVVNVNPLLITVTTHDGRNLPKSSNCWQLLESGQGVLEDVALVFASDEPPIHSGLGNIR